MIHGSVDAREAFAQALFLIYSITYVAKVPVPEVLAQTDAIALIAIDAIFKFTPVAGKCDGAVTWAKKAIRRAVDALW